MSNPNSGSLLGGDENPYNISHSNLSVSHPADSKAAKASLSRSTRPHSSSGYQRDGGVAGDRGSGLVPASILASSAAATAVGGPSNALGGTSNDIVLAPHTADVKANPPQGNRARVVRRLCESNLALLKKAARGSISGPVQGASPERNRGPL